MDDFDQALVDVIGNEHPETLQEAVKLARLRFSESDEAIMRAHLPRVFVEALEIAEGFELSVEDCRVHVRIVGSIYKDLYSEVKKVSRVCESFGCPLCSSTACALARASGKPVVMEGNEVSPDGNVMDVYYHVLEE